LLDVFEQTILKGVTSWQNAYNDPDMLVVGLEHMDTQRNIIHFTLWAVMNAPLIIGQDIRKMPDELLSVYLNKKVISIN
jgi:alpha-galactosidase